MADEETPVSYLVLEPGTTVEAADGERIGTVEHVLALVDEDVFDGIVVRTEAGLRFADADQVETITDRRVRLALPLAEARRLPEPTGTAPSFHARLIGRGTVAWEEERP